MLELQACVYVCVLDQWAGDSDRLVCSKHFFGLWIRELIILQLQLTEACTQTHSPTEAFTHAYTQPFSADADAHSHMDIM